MSASWPKEKLVQRNNNSNLSTSYNSSRRSKVEIHYICACANTVIKRILQGHQQCNISHTLMLLVRAEALVTWGKAPNSANIINIDDVKICLSSSAAWFIWKNLVNVGGMGRSREVNGETIDQTTIDQYCKTSRN